MKRLKSHVLLIVLLLSTSNVYAQSYESDDDYDDAIYRIGKLFCEYDYFHQYNNPTSDFSALKFLDTIIDIYNSAIKGDNYSYQDYEMLRYYYKKANYYYARYWYKYYDNTKEEQYIDRCINHLRPFFPDSMGGDNVLHVVKTLDDSEAYLYASKAYYIKACYNNIYLSGIFDTINGDTIYYYYDSCADTAKYFYDIANVTLDNVYNIMNTAYIKDVYSLIGDTISSINRFNQIAKYFYYHPEQIYQGVDDIIWIDSNRYDTISYACYSMEWLRKQKRYRDALDFYDKISSKVPNDVQLKTYQFLCFGQLGYYGDELLTIWQHSYMLDKGQFYRPEDKVNYNIIMYYMRKQYHKAIHYCNKTLNERSQNAYALMMRGACYEQLSNRKPVGLERDILSEKALADYKKALEINQIDEDNINPYLYAKLGRYDEAIKHAQENCHLQDSILANTHCSEEDSIEAADHYLSLAETYCLTGHFHKAKSSLRRAFSINHSPIILSIAMTMPYLEPIKKDAIKLIKRYAKKDGIVLKQLETDTLITFVEYIPKKGVIYIPVTINGYTVDSIIFDSGASDVQISREFAKQMRIANTLSWDDSLRKSYQDANGNITENPVVTFKSITIGNLELHNISGHISESEMLLLGQSAISNLIIEMDPNERILTFKQVKYKR